MLKILCDVQHATGVTVDNVFRCKSQSFPSDTPLPHNEMSFFRFGNCFFVCALSVLLFFCSHILEKAFDSKGPAHEVDSEIIHLCCCVSCPLHAKKDHVTNSSDTCILSASKNSIMKHWYDALNLVSNNSSTTACKSTTIFLHGLGSDLMTKCVPDTETDEKFSNLSSDQEKAQFIATRMDSNKDVNVIRVTFDGKEQWPVPGTCVIFHQMVSDHGNLICDAYFSIYSVCVFNLLFCISGRTLHQHLQFRKEETYSEAFGQVSDFSSPTDVFDAGLEVAPGAFIFAIQLLFVLHIS